VHAAVDSGHSMMNSAPCLDMYF